MNTPIQNEAEMKEPKYEQFIGSNQGVDTSDGPNVSMKDPDTTLSMIVLLLTCLALAALAHVIVP